MSNTPDKPSSNTPSNTPSAPRTPFRLTLTGLLAPAPLAAVFLVEAIIFKAVQTSAILNGFAFGPFVLSILPDIAFAILFALPFAAAFSATNGRLRVGVSVLFHLLSLLVLVLYAGSHGYFQATGANLSLSPIEYLIANAGASSGVVSSEASWDRLLVLFSQPLFVLISVLLVHTQWVRRRLENRPPLSPKRSIALLAGAAAVGIALQLAPAPRGPVASVARSIPGAIVWELVTDKLIAVSDVDIGEKEQFGTDLALKRTPGSKRPNIVFILFESLSWKHSDVYFPGQNTTPFLAKLAEKGQVIDRMYATVPHTTKAIVSALCGLYPYFETPPKEAVPGILPRRCLAHILASQGYETAFFQPAFNFEHRDDLAYNMGYHEYRGLKDMPRKGFESMSYFGAEDKMMLGPSMDWVASVKDDGPFFLTYMTLATHHNYAVPQSFPYIDYDVEDNDLRNYLNAVRYIDSFIKEVFTEIDKMGLTDDTIFIITGDHGEGFFEHRRRQHDLVIFEEGLHIASLMYGPEKYLGKPRHIKGVRSSIDWVPTVADILGLTLEEGRFVGSSLLKPVPDDRELFHSCWFRRQCMAKREGDLKTIYFYGLRPMEVYNNREDPFDEHDLAFTGHYDQAFLDAREEEMERFKRVVDQQFETWERDLSEGKVVTKKPHVTQKISARFGDVIELVGVDISSRSAKPGSSFDVRYVFKCIAPPKPGDSLFIHILHDGDFINADHVPVSGTYPPEKWKPGEYIIDAHKIHVPKSWEGGTIRIGVGFWNTRTKRRLAISDTDLEVDNRRLVINEMPLKSKGAVRSGSGFSMAKLREKIKDHLSDTPFPVKHPLGVVFGDTVELTGFDPDRMDVELAGTVEMTYIFKALKNVPRGWRLTVRLVRDDGKEVKGDHTPLNGLYPLQDWRVNEYVSDKHMIHIDMYRTRTGTYKAYLGFKAGGGRPVRVTAPAGAEIDDQQRVYLGDVIIRKDHDPHLRR